MSATFSDSTSAPNEPITPAVVGDTCVVGAPLDFSGASLFFPENFAGSTLRADAPIGSPQSAAEAAALSDALCAKISPVSFGDRVLLLPSECDAWRSAVEMVRRYHGVVGRPKRRRFIVCVGPADATESPPPGLEGDDEIVILRTDDHAALQAEVDVRTAGILIPPVRTQASFEIVSGSVLARLRETADEYGLILGFDETFCGLGRSGMLWAHEWTGVTPDLMIASHAPADAPPLAALVVTQRLARGALGGSPLVEEAALLSGHALVDALSTPGFQERVQNRSWYFEDQLSALFYRRRAAFTALDGLGLMQALTLPGDAEPMRAKLAEHGLLTRAMGPVLGLFPPLTVEEGDIDAAVSVIDMVCAQDER
ncbi:MAG: acetylornithine and succinylornithine aminotransferase [Methylocystaceae bacterium]|nr:MAG: acetylornithine and succinylornithine aminotransferase [Methylocystaceae bacterium]KAF0214043.1 MAG: acetylornithine and succinylornithine [Methylocystaceae bacterium]TXT46947.1 MAG: acetylornithine and succinylornithine aminotransferase [Methylocystaceae bacterium]